MTWQSKPELRFTLSELAGAFGDFGTIIPLLLAVALVTGMNLGMMLLFFGIWFIITGLYYGLPIPIEPMKAIAVIAIAERMNSGEIVAAGIILGILFLLLSYGPLLLWLETVIPPAVVRGIQLGLALLLVKSAAVFILDDPVYACIGLAVIVTFAVFVLYSTRVPDLSALVIIAIGIAAGVSVHGIPGIQFLSAPTIVVPSVSETITALYYLVPSQAFLTVTNAILATALLTRDLFAREIPSARFSRTIGLMTLTSVPFGGFPMCHGAGGLAAQYRYGARTAAASIIAGIIFCITALVFASPATLALIPLGLFGALLLFAAIEMGKHSIRTDAPVITFLVGIGALLSSITLAFVGGLIVFWIWKRIKPDKGKTGVC